jgi:hypothetical protein
MKWNEIIIIIRIIVHRILIIKESKYLSKKVRK